MWIDKKLDFKKHVEKKIGAARKVTGAIRGLCGGRKGMGVGNARRMYIACARGTMEYGSRVWWKGQVGLAAMLDKENEKAMRKIGGHM